MCSSAHAPWFRPRSPPSVVNNTLPRRCELPAGSRRAPRCVTLRSHTPQPHLAVESSQQRGPSIGYSFKGSLGRCRADLAADSLGRVARRCTYRKPAYPCPHLNHRALLTQARLVPQFMMMMMMMMILGSLGCPRTGRSWMVSEQVNRIEGVQFAQE